MAAKEGYALQDMQGGTDMRIIYLVLDRDGSVAAVSLNRSEAEDIAAVLSESCKAGKPYHVQPFLTE